MLANKVAFTNLMVACLTINHTGQNRTAHRRYQAGND